MRLLDLMEPEETVGKLWHDMASEIRASVTYPEAAVALATVRASLAVLFRALGGAPGVDLSEAPATLVQHRRPMRRRLGADRDREWIASFDGECLRLPPFIAAFPNQTLNRSAYFWLTAQAALFDMKELQPAQGRPALDHAQLKAAARSTDQVLAACPGLRVPYARMAALCLKARPTDPRSGFEATLERAICDQLGGVPCDLTLPERASDYRPFAPVPIWLRYTYPISARLRRRLRPGRHLRPQRPSLPTPSWVSARTKTSTTARTASSYTGSNRSCHGPSPLTSTAALTMMTTRMRRRQQTIRTISPCPSTTERLQRAYGFTLTCRLLMPITRIWLASTPIPNGTTVCAATCRNTAACWRHPHRKMVQRL